MKTMLNILCAGWLVLVLGCACAWAQATAQITGVATDQSGAVLPGVDVTATQTDTGISRSAVTNETGSYVLPNLPVGPYRVEAALPGFRTFVQTGVTLQVNSNPVINIVLQIGQLTEVVEVQSNAAMVETRSTGVGQVIDNAQILQLPLVGRQVTDLVVLAGAAVQTGVSANNARNFPGIARFSIAGGFEGGNSYLLDGTMHNDVRANAGLPLPFPDALQEFKVETSAVPAQFGFHSGAAINAVTKSGTNDFHGTAFLFTRDKNFNARGFFDTVRDPLKRNQFGGTLGGPVRQNKLFFFGGYQGTTTRSNPGGSRSTVPTLDMLQGDFTAIASTRCRSSALTLRGPFNNNRVDPSLFSKAALNITKLLPPPLDECGLVEWGIPVSRNEHQVVGKIDYQHSPTHSIFGRYLAQTYRTRRPHEITGNVLAGGTAGVDDLFQSIVIGNTYAFGPRIVNSFRIGGNRSSNTIKPAEFFDAQDVGINMYQVVPDIMTMQITGGFNLGAITGMRVFFADGGGHVNDDLGILWGDHQIGIGVSAMSYQVNHNSTAFANGLIVFQGGTTGLGLADFLLGNVTTLTQGGPNFLYSRMKYFGLYAQDTWKVRTGLTLSYGLRWEPYIPQQFGQNTMNYFDRDAYVRGERTPQYVNAPPGFFYPGDPQFPSDSSNYIRKRWKHVAPRLGIVWDPEGDGRMVVRAAYGIFHELNSGELNLTIPQGAPWGGKVVLDNPGGGLDDPYKGVAGGNPFPFVRDRNAPFAPGGVFATAFPDTQSPYVQQWNLGVQREIMTNWLVSASYVGNAVVHVYGARELNAAIFIPGVADSSGRCFTTLSGGTYSINVTPGSACSTTANTVQRRPLTLLNPVEGRKVNFISAWDDTGTRSYNGMILSLQKRMSNNFSLTGNYTLSHCITTPVNILLNGTAGAGVLTDDNNRNYDRGDCPEDRRHIVNATTVFEMPRFANPWLQRFAGDWGISGILRLQSGSPFDVVSGVDTALTGKNTGTQRLHQISPDVYGNKCTNDLRASAFNCLWLNRDAFAVPASGTLGNMSPGTIRGPGNWTIDAGLSRSFVIREAQRVEIRAEATNVLNHTNFNNPTGNRSSAAFGRIQSARDPRIMQFALKYVF
jgi:hypothetical protein